MSLTLEDIHQVRFRMSSRNVSGYRVEDVDSFIDRVEEAFSRFESEKDLLRREAEASGGASVPVAESDDSAAKDREIAELRAEVQALRNAPATQTPVDDGRVEALTSANDELRAELGRVRAELDEARTQRVTQLVGQSEQITVTTTSEASPAVVRLVQLAAEQSEQLVAEADAEAQRKIADAQQQAREITTDARTKADRIESEARVNAEQLRREAREDSERVTSDAAQRRQELFADLEREQGELTGKVGALRDFEGRFRDGLRDMLSKHLDQLDQAAPEPAEVPTLAQGLGSETPRLDALANPGND